MSITNNAFVEKESGNVIRIVFICLNILLLTLGLYLWIAYSLYRILILYSTLNLIFIWLIWRGKKDEKHSYVELDVREKAILHKRVFNILSSLPLILTVLMILITCKGMYVRPPELIYISLITLTLFFIILFIGHLLPINLSGHHRLPFLLATMLIIAFTRFSVYFVQPGIHVIPTYATVDAYRDYTNAYRILHFSHFSQENMILERYYRAFPVVPLQIAIINLASTIPLSLVVIIFGLIIELMQTVLLFLLATCLIKIINYSDRYSLFIVLSSTLLPLLHPLHLDPMFILTPLRFSMLFTILLTYICIRQVAIRSNLRSFAIPMILIIMMIIPLHASSTFFALILFSIFIMSYLKSKEVKHDSIIVNLIMMVVVCAIYFVLYLVFTVQPLLSVMSLLSSILQVLEDILIRGPSIITEKGIPPIRANEYESFLIALPTAFLMSTMTVFIAESWRKGKHNKSFLQKVFFYCNIFLLFTYIFAQLIPLWRIDARYFIFPAHHLLIFPIIYIFAHVNSSNGRLRENNIVMLLMLISYAVAVVISPSFIHEVSPLYARLTPINSEIIATEYTLSHVDHFSHKISQIIADWPFYAFVRSLIYTKYMHLEAVLEVPTLMYVPPAKIGSVTMCRQYFYNSPFLQSVSQHMSIFKEVKYNTIVDRIYDSGSIFEIISS